MNFKNMVDNYKIEYKSFKDSQILNLYFHYKNFIDTNELMKLKNYIEIYCRYKALREIVFSRNLI